MEKDQVILQLLNQKYTEDWILLYLIKKYPDSDPDMLRETIQRVSQSQFRELIIKRDGNCIISGFDPVECEAAHIIPYAISKSYEISNGILLNRCLHKLFDEYLFTINPDTNQIIIADESKHLSINLYQRANVPFECRENLKIHYKTFLDRNKLMD